MIGTKNSVKPYRLSIVLAGILLMAGDACTSDSQLERSKQTNMITARVGEEFTITLDSNPTTGYSWKLSDDFSEGVVELLGSEYKPTEIQRIGGGGKNIWRFKAIAVGETQITLYYRRPWEKDKPPSTTKTFSITVK